MLDAKQLQNLKYVINSDGEKSAVQLDIKTWETLIEYIEDLEDRALVKDKLVIIQNGPSESGAVPWQAINKEW